MNSEQVARVAQMANRLTWESHLESDRTAKFDPADPREILGEAVSDAPTTFHRDLPVGPPTPAPIPRSDRVSLYSSPNEQPAGNPMQAVDEFSDQAKVASYEAESDFVRAKGLFVKTASVFDAAIQEALWGEGTQPGTLAAAVAKMVQDGEDTKLAGSLLKSALESASEHGLDTTINLEHLPRGDFEVDDNHPVAVAFRAAIDAAATVKTAGNRLRVLKAADQGADDVAKRILSR